MHYPADLSAERATPETTVHLDCMGTPLMIGDTVELIDGSRVVVDALIVDTWGCLRFVHGTRTQPSIVCKLFSRPNTPPAEAAIEAVAADVAPELGVCALRSNEERRRMSAAAAHAYEMQAGGTHD